jgi:hypothetical protein
MKKNICFTLFSVFLFMNVYSQNYKWKWTNDWKFIGDDKNRGISYTKPVTNYLGVNVIYKSSNYYYITITHWYTVLESAYYYADKGELEFYTTNRNVVNASSLDIAIDKVT